MSQLFVKLKKYSWIFVVALIAGASLAELIDPASMAWLGYSIGFLVFIVNVVLMALIIKLLFRYIAASHVSEIDRPKPSLGPFLLGLLGFFKVGFILGVLYLSLAIFDMSALFIAAGCFVALGCFGFVAIVAQLKRNVPTA